MHVVAIFNVLFFLLIINVLADVLIFEWLINICFHFLVHVKEIHDWCTLRRSWLVFILAGTMLITDTIKKYGSWRVHHPLILLNVSLIDILKW